MSAYQRTKGHNWERAVAAMLREIFGEDVKRGQQGRDGADAPDVDAPFFWVECKVGAQTNIKAALRQATAAIEKARDSRYALAVCKDDREEPIAAMYLDDFLELVAQWEVAISILEEQRRKAEEGAA